MHVIVEHQVHTFQRERQSRRSCVCVFGSVEFPLVLPVALLLRANTHYTVILHNRCTHSTNVL
jgi:hypothetical protein